MNKDTVMPNSMKSLIYADWKSNPFNDNADDRIKNLIIDTSNIQAEISYKAGIKLVVDWLKENSWDDDGVQLFIPTDWQDQVKEWDV